MRDVPGIDAADLTTLLAGGVGWVPVVAAWRDGVLLAETVPVIAGRCSATIDAQVPDRVEITVPEADASRSWVPGVDTAHPLARYGQALDVSVRITTALGTTYQCRVGWFPVHSWEHDDTTRTVHAVGYGVLRGAQEAQFTHPETPASGGTLESEFRRLMPSGVSVTVSGDLTDRACPTSFQWQTDRLAALYEIADCWPARIHTDQYGSVRLDPPLDDVPDPVLAWVDGAGGTLVAAPSTDTREGRPNQVVATGSAIDTTAMDPVCEIAEITAGPMAVTTDGSGYGIVTEHYSSPLITTPAEALAAAQTVLARKAGPTQTVTVETPPDPRVELGDPAAVTRGDTTWWGYVTGWDLPLTIDDGAMRVTVGVTA
jgi:hypothetical protein